MFAVKLLAPGQWRSIHSFVVGLMLTLPACCVAQPQPNVVFLSIDDLNDWTGYLAGHPDAKTPNIDALAARGMMFTRAYCNAPACKPSRTSLMSGVRPSTTGIYFNNSQGEDDLFSHDYSTTPEVYPVRAMPQFFADNGYTTYGVGKLFHGTGDADRWTVLQPVNPEAGANINSGPIDFGPFPDSQADGLGADGDGDGIPDDDDRDYAAATFVVRSITNHDPGTHPFYVGCGLYRPHLPFRMPQSFWNQYFSNNVALPSVRLPVVLTNAAGQQVDIDDLGPFGRAMARNVAYNDPDGLTEPAPGNSQHDGVLIAGEWRDAVAAYLACVGYIDAQVGRVVQAVDDAGLASNTIFILWSDHGWQLGEKQSWRKFALWEDSTRVNLIVVAPGVTTPGTVCHKPVELLDIYPTLADLCGLPEGRFLQGRNLRPLIENPNGMWAVSAATEEGINYEAIRTDRYRYIRYATGEEEFYDYETDSSRSPANGGSGWDGLDDWDNLVDKAGGIIAPGYEQAFAALKARANTFWAPNRTGAFNGVFPWAAYPNRPYPAQTVTASAGGTLEWSCGFEPGEGFPYGFLGGHLGWRASREVYVTARAGSDSYQSLSLPGDSFVSRDLDTAASRAVWMKFRGKLCPTQTPLDTSNGRFPVSFFPNAAGQLTAWHANSNQWVASTRVVSNAWHTYECFFDYENKQCNLRVDGMLVFNRLPFNESSLERCTEFRFGQGAVLTGGDRSFLDDLMVHAVAGIEVNTDYDVWVRQFFPDGVFGGGSPSLDADDDGWLTINEFDLQLAPDAVDDPMPPAIRRAPSGEVEIEYVRRDPGLNRVRHEIAGEVTGPWLTNAGRLTESILPWAPGESRVVLSTDPVGAEDPLFFRLALIPKGSVPPPPTTNSALLGVDFEGVIRGTTTVEQLQSLTTAGTWTDVRGNAELLLTFRAIGGAPDPGLGSLAMVLDAQVEDTAATDRYELRADLTTPAALNNGCTIRFDFAQYRSGNLNNKNQFVTGYDSASNAVFRLVLQNYNYLDTRTTTRQIPGYEYLNGSGLAQKPAIGNAEAVRGAEPAAFLWGSDNAAPLDVTLTVRLTLALSESGWTLSWLKGAVVDATVLLPYYRAAVAGLPQDLAFLVFSGEASAGGWFDNVLVLR